MSIPYSFFLPSSFFPLMICADTLFVDKVYHNHTLSNSLPLDLNTMIELLEGGEYKVSPNHPKYKTISENLAVLTEEEILSLVKITENKPPKIIE